ncbi:MAG: His/Gly/Thr/Pro-type tRNA ligase C-terminal domain-containing protein, partial [Nanopusillaceae archaeon]
RLIDAGLELGIFKLDKKTYTELCVIYFEDTFNDAWNICNRLRDLGINCYIDLMKRDFEKQIKYAVDKDIRFLLIVGKKELSRNKVLLQDRYKKEKMEIDKDNLREVVKIISERLNVSTDK